MIDINQVRQNQAAFAAAINRKRIPLDLAALLQADARRKTVLTAAEELRRQRNLLSAATKTVSEEERQNHLETCKQVTTQLEQMEQQLRSVTEEFEQLALLVPSLPAPQVPDGDDDGDNVEIKRWGEPRLFQFPLKDHLELAELHGLANFVDAREFAGSRAYALMGNGALLEMAVMRFAIDHLLRKSFVPVTPPLAVRHHAMLGTGYFPLGEENAYTLEQDKLYLVGTSEVPLVAMHANHVLPGESLPMRFLGISTCFRREAGAAGKDTKGLYRVHQFQKVEQVVITTDDPETTAKEHEFLLANAEEILQALELPYRVVTVCAGELGLGQVLKHDIETWMPSRGDYCETHSCSTLNDFQARRLNIKWKDETGAKRYAHTLNNTAVASPRILIPLLEVHQQEDGSVRIPAALRPYMGGLSCLRPG